MQSHELTSQRFKAIIPIVNYAASEETLNGFDGDIEALEDSTFSLILVRVRRDGVIKLLSRPLGELDK